MFTFITQTWDTIQHGSGHYFAIFYLVVNWYFVCKWLVARHYRPYERPFKEGAAPRLSVIIPVVDEPLREFRLVLTSIMACQPYEIIVIINGKRNLGLEEVCDSLGVTYFFTPVAGKRNAVVVGVEKSTGDVIALVDSDTTWTNTTMEEMLKPFANPSVGGVTTNQRVFRARKARRRSWLIRFAAWMEEVRTDFSMRAMSVFGTVGCLPGRTIAFRREVFTKKNLERFMNEKFLGVFLEISDDRTLTNYCLQLGYKTVFQSTAVVYTDAPNRWKVYLRQQARWARGSQYNNLRMAWFMMRKAKFLAFVYFMDTIIPFFWLGTIINLAWKVYISHPLRYGLGEWWEQAAWIAAGLVLSAALRNLPHLRRQKDDWKYLPAYILMLSLVLTPIRLVGFFRMAHDTSWGTRAAAHGGGGQVHLKTIVPYLLGTFLVLFFGALGPLIETWSASTEFAVRHWRFFSGTGMLLMAFFVAVTLRRYVISLVRARKVRRLTASPTSTEI